MYTYTEKRDKKMNERIKELAEEAGMVIVNDEFSTYGKFAEKFAELIVTETCKMLAENREFRAATLVGKHFPLWK